MQKIFLPLLLLIVCITQSKAQQRLFDQPVQLKACNISIDANPFIATTVIEMEFYNPRDAEVEGLHSFELNRGQVITGFQLELNGKYREGSIEERWKARQAYSSIVGKRIDPAILQMNGRDHFSINIYPIAAKSSRKIKFTITQMMVAENLKLSYTLPLQFITPTASFKLQIRIKKPNSLPYARSGLLEDQLFSMNNEEAVFSMHKNDIILNRPVSFSINQLGNAPQYCINKKNGHATFLMRFYPGAPRFYTYKPKTINVYWDVSLSGKERNLMKELDYLERYISVNEISKATIFLFNQQLQGVISYSSSTGFNSIRNYLLSYPYAGATELGNLDFSNILADAVLLFSDGVNSIGNAKPKTGAVPVNFIVSSYRYNYYQYKNIIGNTGGSVINLYYSDVKDAVKRTDSAENFLFKFSSPYIHINEPFPLKLGSSIVLSGTMDKADNLELFYGNNSATYRSENYFLPYDDVCDENTYRKMRMLKTYDSLVYGDNYYYHWQDMVIFGLTEKVVTPQTSFLVLERVEDYIKYKIAPPEELEAKCAELNYVYRSEYKIKALKDFTEQESLETLVKDYNKRISWWSKAAALIDLDKPVPEQPGTDINSNPPAAKSSNAAVNTGILNDFSGGKGELKEVVVTSAFGIKRTARSTASSVQNLTNEQVNTIRQINVNDALAGKIAGVQVRSQSIAKLGAETTIRLRGENGFGVGSGALYVLDGTIMPSMADINPDNIEDYSILQGPAAAALFGPDGANGAIVMTSKKAKRGYPRQYYTWGNYTLSSAEDEDYVVEMKKAADYELWDTFLELEKQHKTDVGFYFEMANFFFDKGNKDKAQELLYNAVELCQGSIEGLRLTAYMYEQWKWFDKAIAVYKGILSQQENNLMVKRELALAYFQNKNYEASVKTYYSVITAAGDNENNNIKVNALAEMNAVLVLHKNEFDISYINQNLVKQLPVDLRISVSGNYSYTGNTQFTEPGNAICSSSYPNTVNGGRFTGNDYTTNYRYYYSLTEYAIKTAPAGRYKIKIDAYNNYSYPAQIPMFVRVITFKNFQKINMEMEIKLFDLDNQYGVVELDEVSW